MLLLRLHLKCQSLLPSFLVVAGMYTVCYENVACLRSVDAQKSIRNSRRRCGRSSS